MSKSKCTCGGPLTEAFQMVTAYLRCRWCGMVTPK